MLISVATILPVIALIAIGYFAVRLNFIDKSIGTFLNQYVFVLAAPALLFRNTAKTAIPDVIPWELWISYYVPIFICLAIGVLVSFLVSSRHSSVERIIIGFGSGFSNTVMLGIPVILTAFGEGASTPLFLILAFHGLLVFSMTTLIMESVSREPKSFGSVVMAIVKSFQTNNVLIALLLGVLWGRTGLGIAEPIDDFLSLLGRSTIPVALIAIGATLAITPVREAVGEALYVSGIKLIIHPALVFVFGYYVFDLPGLWVATSTVLAGMPAGVFTAVFAQRYEANPGAASSMIMISTLISAGTLIILLSLFSDYLI
jgi:predicted permease